MELASYLEILMYAAVLTGNQEMKVFKLKENVFMIKRDDLTGEWCSVVVMETVMVLDIVTVLQNVWSSIENKRYTQPMLFLSILEVLISK